jgi:hypothetical protein
VSRFSQYYSFVMNAENELRAGGDTEKAKVWAMLAQAEIIAATEFDGKIELSGDIIVNT